MENKFFDISKKKEIVEKPKEVWESKMILSHFQKLDNCNELKRLPSNNEHFFLQSDTAFNAFTFIPFICKNVRIKQLYASTYSISRRVIDALFELHEKGVVENITLMISDSMIKRNPIVIDNLMAMTKKKPNFTVQYAWVHAKVCIIETHHQDYYVIEGSGNWSENAQYEQYLFANSKGLYDFRLQLFTNINLKKY